MVHGAKMYSWFLRAPRADVLFHRVLLAATCFSLDSRHCLASTIKLSSTRWAARAMKGLFAGSAHPNYSVKWTAATCHGNLTLTVAAATYLKR